MGVTRKAEISALAPDARRYYVLAYRFHQMFRDCKTSPTPFANHRECSLDLSERIEQFVQIFGLDADDGIDNSDHECVSLIFADADETYVALRHELEGVGEQIVERPPDAHRQPLSLQSTRILGIQGRGQSAPTPPQGGVASWGKRRL